MKARFWDAMLDLAVALNRLTERLYLYAFAHRRPNVD